jgi:hypothetical protein
MEPTVLLPLRRKACWGFFRPKNLTAFAGCEPATWVPKASTLPLDHRSHSPPALTSSAKELTAIYTLSHYFHLIMLFACFSLSVECDYRQYTLQDHFTLLSPCCLYTVLIRLLHNCRLYHSVKCNCSIWHSEDRASWYILIIKANEIHYFSLLDKVLYIFQRGPLSIIRIISTLYICNRYLCC